MTAGVCAFATFGLTLAGRPLVGGTIRVIAPLAMARRSP